MEEGRKWFQSYENRKKGFSSMGRSRKALLPILHEEDPSQRSKRKRNGSNTEIPKAGFVGDCLSTDQVAIREKVAQYHCNYCNKDISGKIRIKCVVCQDFDLCMECFSVGAEITHHKCNHPYRVMDNLSIPLICPGWNADEEMLLLEGIEIYGFGNWTEVAEHVGTKSKAQCIDHYNTFYMNSPCFPLPDLSHIMGKSREELAAMYKECEETNKEFHPPVEVKEEPPLCAGINYQVPKKEEETSHFPSSDGYGSNSNKTFSSTTKKASDMGQPKDEINPEKYISDRSIGEKKPKISGEDGPTVTELCGYNFNRQEFEIEYDNDAEQVLADMEFKDADTPAEREIKLRVLRVYSRRLDERKRRKEFILERDLLYPDSLENFLSPEEREICKCYRVFARFHSKEEHEELLRSIVEEHRMVKRIKELQEARVAGCRTSIEARRYIYQMRMKEVEQTLQKVNGQGSNGKALDRPDVVKVESDVCVGGDHIVTAGGFDSFASRPSFSRSLDWDITGFPGSELLSETEKKLCSDIRVLPAHYLNMLQVISVEISKGTVTKKADAHSLFKVEGSKVDKVYDMLVAKGIAQA